MHKARTMVAHQLGKGYFMKLSSRSSRILIACLGVGVILGAVVWLNHRLPTLHAGNRPTPRANGAPPVNPAAFKVRAIWLSCGRVCVH